MRPTKRLAIGALMIGLAVLLIISGMALRTYELDRAAAALKVGDGARAVRILEPLGHVGDNTAQILLGHVYAYGMAGAPKNDARAISWFERSASGWFHIGKRIPFSVAELERGIGETYLMGEGGPQKDVPEGLKWLRRAAALGDDEAKQILGKYRS